MTLPLPADVELLEKVLLGQLSSADAERLTKMYADDSRLSQLVDSLAHRADTLIDSLRQHQPTADPDADRLVERLLQRLKLSQDKTLDSSIDTISPAPAEGSAPAVLPERLEYFRVEKVLGEGGMGTVYLADDTRLGRRVALKTLKRELAQNPQARERFLREARSAAKLEHDHIIPIYYVGEADGTPFLAMPFLRGESLHDYLNQSAEPVPVARVLKIGREIAAGLAVAHALGLIHRDIKPANIWLEAPSGRVKILDFGLARAASADANLTASGTIVGTPAFMAPEQGRGLHVDHRADLFSLGCVLYQMLTGTRAIDGPDAMSILASLALDSPAEPDTINLHCPRALSRLVMRLLEKDPSARLASAEAVVEALTELEGTPAVQPPASAVESEPTFTDLAPSGIGDEVGHSAAIEPPARTPVRRKRRLGRLVVVGLLIALVGLGIRFGGMVVRFATNKGELVVEIDDKDVEVRVIQNGVVVLDKLSKREFTLTAGKGEIEVLEKDGIKLMTKKFELTRGGKTTITVTLKELSDARNPTKDPDRRAAEYVLAIGGDVSVTEGGKERPIKAVADLPRGAFELTSVSLENNPKVSRAGLANFKSCKELRSLHLSGATLDDEGLAYFKDCKNLTGLNLYATGVSDVGLAHFQGCNQLDYLNLMDTKVSDTGLAYFKECRNLTHLLVDSPQATDAGVANFKDCKNLTALILLRTKVTDVGVGYFKNCRNLREVSLNDTLVGNAGLAQLKDCKKLTILYLNGLRITDAGLVHLKNCNGLERLGLRGTKVSDAGVDTLAEFSKLELLQIQDSQITRKGYERLRGALPKCNIEWDESDPDRRAAEWVLSIGGSVGVNGEKRHINRLAELPKVPFVLTGVGLHGNKHVTDEGLANLRGCKHLLSIGLFTTKVTDKGLAHLKDCKDLQEFSLGRTAVTDAGMVYFSGCKNLTFIELTSTQVTDAGLAHLKDCKNLEQVRLYATQTGDGFLAQLKDCKGLNQALLGGRVTDAGLAYLKECPELNELDLQYLGITDAGLVHLKEYKKLSALLLNGTQVSDAGMAHLKDCKSLVRLGLRDTQVTDMGLEHIKSLKTLAYLGLDGTSITDAGVSTHLAGLTHLTLLTLHKTRVGAPGIERLRQALPKCKIEWDGGAIEPGKK